MDNISIRIYVNSIEYIVPLDFLKLSTENQKQLITWLRSKSTKIPRDMDKEFYFAKNFCDKMLHSTVWSALLHSTDEIL